MKKEPTKLSLSIGLTQYEVNLLEKAAKVTIRYHGDPQVGDRVTKNYRRLLRLAILAYTRALITSGIDYAADWGPYPQVAELRNETKEECEARQNGVVTEESANPPDWKMPNRWN